MANEKSTRLSPMIVSVPEDGREYTLEFNRKTVKKSEQSGLDINELGSKSMTMVSLLFWGAFLMHHPHMTQEQTDKILFEQLNGLTADEMEYLGKLYAEPFQTLVASEEEGANPRRAAVKF